MRKIYILLILVCFLFISCTHQIAINPTIHPHAFSAEKLPYSVGVVFSEEMRTYIQHARPSTWSGSAHTYNFEIGNSLCASLLRSVEAAYFQVFDLKSNPRKGEYDRIIKYSLQNSNMDIYFQDGFLTTSGKANYTISIMLEAFNDKSLRMLRKNVISGSGFSTRNTDAFSADKHFAKSIETAIQQVSDNAANLFISGFAEHVSNHTSGANENTNINKSNKDIVKILTEPGKEHYPIKNIIKNYVLITVKPDSNLRIDKIYNVYSSVYLNKKLGKVKAIQRKGNNIALKIIEGYNQISKGDNIEIVY